MPERDFYALTKRGETASVSYEVIYDRLKAPISQGETVGELILYRDGIECDRMKVVAACAVEKANFFDRLREIARGWNG
jgi:D-alanyl-D-alanine carboxypeptidase